MRVAGQAGARTRPAKPSGSAAVPAAAATRGTSASTSTSTARALLAMLDERTSLAQQAAQGRVGAGAGRSERGGSGNLRVGAPRGESGDGDVSAAGRGAREGVRESVVVDGGVVGAGEKKGARDLEYRGNRRVATGS